MRIPRTRFVLLVGGFGAALVFALAVNHQALMTSDIFESIGTSLSSSRLSQSDCGTIVEQPKNDTPCSHVTSRPTPRYAAVNFNGSMQYPWQWTIGKVEPSCKYIYLDIGSNRGVQVRKLFEPSLYPKAATVEHFAKYFPEEVRDEVCAFGWEPMPLHDEYLRYIMERYTEHGWRTYFFTSHGVADKDGESSVEMDVKDGRGNGYWGARIDAARRDDRESTGKMRFDIRTMNLSRFLNLVKEVNPVRVVAKMDIEGMEHVLLPLIIEDKSICVIDAMTMETHDRDTKPSFDEYSTNVTNACSNTALLSLDDETFGMSNLRMCV